MKKTGGQGEIEKVAQWGLHSRAVTPSNDRESVKWHERLVMELPKG